MDTRIEIPEYFNFAQYVDTFAETHADKRAIVWVNEQDTVREISYGQLQNRSNQIAQVFLKAGVEQGDKVLVLLPRIPEAYLVYLALNKMGAVILPGSEMLRSKDIEYRVNHSEAKAVIAFPGVLEEVETIRSACPTLELFWMVDQESEHTGWRSLLSDMQQAPNVAPDVQTRADELAFLSYTSGTTGGPKGVMHTHGWAYAHMSIAATYWFDVQETDLAWATAGPGWAKWIWSPFVSILGKGGTAFVYLGRFDPQRYLQLIERYQVSLLCATPTEYRLMAKLDQLDHFSLPSLRSANSAGEPLNREVIDTFRRHFGITVRDGYGQTENTLLVGTFVGMEPRPGSMGQPSPSIRVAIIDQLGNPLPVGEIGDIAVDRNTPVLFKGYLNDPERTAKAFRGEWYVTGDQGRMDEEGYIWFEGRADDIIISSGYTIGPFEVEDALVKHAAVAECAVVASPDPDRGHIVKAFVVLKDANQASDELVKELQEHVKQWTAPYKYPRSIVFVEALPKTTSGKIRRIELRQQ